MLLLIALFLTVNSAPFVDAHSANNRQSDEYYMQLALDMAKKNLKAPFGAVIVDNTSGKILARGVNAVKSNPTYHGEIVAINNCAKKYPQLDWSNVTLFTTAEPCPMCQSAIIWANIPRVVFASSIEHLSRSGWNQITVNASELNSKAPFYKGTITGGVLADKTDALFEQSRR